LNASSDGSDVIAGGSVFQTFAAATGKARSPMALCNDHGTCSDGDDDYDDVDDNMLRVITQVQNASSKTR